MKAVFGVFALCLVATTATVVETPENLVGGFVEEAKEIIVAAAKDLKQQLEDLVNKEIQEAEAILQRIEDLKNESVACVDAEQSNVESILATLDAKMNNCFSDAAETSAQIVSDINKALQQLIFGGVDVVQTFKKCHKMDDGMRKRLCQVNLDAKALRYTWRARRSIRTIKSLKRTVPAVGVDGVACIEGVGSEAVDELAGVVSNIESCILPN